MNINIELTEVQEKFLKEFASKHFSGADDNLCTCNPIHCVQSERFIVVPYSNGVDDYEDKGKVVFVISEDDPEEFTSSVDLIIDYFDRKDKGLNQSQMDGLQEIDDYHNAEEYFKENGIDEEVRVLYKIPYWEDVAFFFILDQAKSYLKYQKHNLGKSRTYTKSAGYSNYGDFNPFRELLIKIGTQLNDESVVK